MRIISSEKIDMSTYGKTTSCIVHCIHAKVEDINLSAKEMIETLSDKSWINKLDTIDQVSFKARSERTINKLVNDILTKVNNVVTEDFGEYLISYSAQNTLELGHTHTKLPLAELLKEKDSGNPGFDFHTESSLNHIAFGEAKYSRKTTPRAKALNQISKFIKLKKDDAELTTLRNFVSGTASTNASENKKGFVAAFSLNSNNPELVFKNALRSKVIDELLVYPELYLIAIET